MSKEAEAYCPDCEKELTNDEFNFNDGCEHCGCKEIFLGQDAFLDFAQAELFPELDGELEDELA